MNTLRAMNAESDGFAGRIVVMPAKVLIMVMSALLYLDYSTVLVKKYVKSVILHN